MQQSANGTSVVGRARAGARRSPHSMDAGRLHRRRLNVAASANSSRDVRRAGGAAAAGTSASVAGPSGSRISRSELNGSLLAALGEQFRRESLPWVLDLVEPFLQGPPRPLTETEAPEQLADPDSRFVDINGVRLHFKMRRPGELEGEGGVYARRAAQRGSRPSAAVAAAAAAPYAAPTAAAGAPAPAPNPDAAPTLLLMHGLNGSTFSWRLLMDDLAAYVSPGTGGCRVIAYDRPPYGLSQRPTEWRSEQDNPYTLEGGARLASGLLGALVPSPPAGLVAAPSVGKAVLVGHSAGASVAVETALRYPDLVCGLVLIAPAISTDERGFLARADLGQLLRFAWTRALLSVDATGINYVRRQVMKRKAEVEAGRMGVYADEQELPQEVIDGYLRPMRAHDWDVGTLMVYRSFQVGGAPQPLEQLRVPVLVLQGREDATVPLQGAQRVTDALRRRGPGSVTEMVVLEGCAHVPMDEQPLEVLKLTTDFINRHCCQPPGVAASAAAATAAAWIPLNSAEAVRSGGSSTGMRGV